MDKQGKEATITIYPDAGHQFENPNNKRAYRPKEAEDGWNQTVAFFEST